MASSVSCLQRSFLRLYLLQFWFSLTKVIAIVVLIITGIVIDLGGTPNHDRIGFRYWKDNNPGAFAQLFWSPDPVTGAPTGGISGSLGRFLAFWQVFVQVSSPLARQCLS